MFYMINNGQEFLVVGHDKVKPLSHFPVSLKKTHHPTHRLAWATSLSASASVFKCRKQGLGELGHATSILSEA